MEARPVTPAVVPTRLEPVNVNVKDDAGLRRVFQMLNLAITTINAIVADLAAVIADYTTDTELAEWAGTANIVTVGTITTGTWNGTDIGDDYISSASTWSGKQDALTFDSFSVVEEDGIVSLSGDQSPVPAQAFYGTNNDAARGWYTLQDVLSSTLTQYITQVGTIATGVWQGTAITDTYIASAATWNAKESALTFSGSLNRSTNTVNLDGDAASPGNSKLYGTNASGTKGWYDQPTGGSYTFSDSLNNSSGTVNLDGDEASPGNGKLYGTDSGGTKQWLDFDGTATEIVVTVGTDGITLSLPDDVDIDGTLTVHDGIIMSYT
jgi:hypothetical protein